MALLLHFPGTDETSKNELLELVQNAATEKGLKPEDVVSFETMEQGVTSVQLSKAELESLLVFFKSITLPGLGEGSFRYILSDLICKQLINMDTLLKYLKISDKDYRRMGSEQVHNVFHFLLVFLSILKAPADADADADACRTLLSEIFQYQYVRDCVFQNQPYLLRLNPSLMGVPVITAAISNHVIYRVEPGLINPALTGPNLSIPSDKLFLYFREQHPRVITLKLGKSVDPAFKLYIDEPLAINLTSYFPNLTEISLETPTMDPEVALVFFRRGIRLYTTSNELSPIPSHIDEINVHNISIAQRLYNSSLQDLPKILTQLSNPMVFSTILNNPAEFLDSFFKVQGEIQASAFFLWTMKAEGRDLILKFFNNKFKRNSSNIFLDEFVSSPGFFGALTTPCLSNPIAPPTALYNMFQSIGCLHKLFTARKYSDDELKILANLILSPLFREKIENIINFQPSTVEESTAKQSVLGFLDSLQKYKPSNEVVSFENCYFSGGAGISKKKLPALAKLFNEAPPALLSELTNSPLFIRNLLNTSDKEISALSCWLQTEDLIGLVVSIVPKLEKQNIESLCRWLLHKYNKDDSNITALWSKPGLKPLKLALQQSIARCITADTAEDFLDLLFKLSFKDNGLYGLLVDLTTEITDPFLPLLFNDTACELLIKHIKKLSDSLLSSSFLYTLLIKLQSTTAQKFVEAVLPRYLKQLLAFLCSKTDRGLFKRSGEQEIWLKLFIRDDFIKHYHQIEFNNEDVALAFLEYCHDTLCLVKNSESSNTLLERVLSHPTLQVLLKQKSPSKKIQKLNKCVTPPKATPQASMLLASEPAASVKKGPSDNDVPAVVVTAEQQKRSPKKTGAPARVEIPDELVELLKGLYEAIKRKDFPTIELSMIEPTLLLLEDSKKRNKLKSLVNLEDNLTHDEFYNLVTIILNTYQLDDPHIKQAYDALTPAFWNRERGWLHDSLTNNLLQLHIINKKIPEEQVLAIFFKRIINGRDFEFLKMIIDSALQTRENPHFLFRRALDTSELTMRDRKTIWKDWLSFNAKIAFPRPAGPPIIAKLLSEFIIANPILLLAAEPTTINIKHFLGPLGLSTLERLLTELTKLDGVVSAIVGSTAASGFKPGRDLDLELFLCERELSVENQQQQVYEILVTLASLVPELHKFSMQAQGPKENFHWWTVKASLGEIPIDFRFVFSRHRLKNTIEATRKERVLNSSACLINLNNSTQYACSQKICLMKPPEELTLFNVGYIFSVIYLKDDLEIDDDLRDLLKFILNPECTNPRLHELREVHLKHICFELVTKKIKDPYLTLDGILAVITEKVFASQGKVSAPPNTTRYVAGTFFKAETRKPSGDSYELKPAGAHP